MTAVEKFKMLRVKKSKEKEDKELLAQKDSKKKKKNHLNEDKLFLIKIYKIFEEPRNQLKKYKHF